MKWKMFLVGQLCGSLLCFLTVDALGQGTSMWVFFGSSGTLEYRPDSHGNKVMDFSTAGYRQGGAALPAVDDARHIAELERKIGQLTMENDFLKKAFTHLRDHHPPAVVNGGDACLKKSSKRRRKVKR